MRADCCAHGVKGFFDNGGARPYIAWLAVAMPPSGYRCGIYARTDIDRGVHKAPANEQGIRSVSTAWGCSQAAASGCGGPHDNVGIRVEVHQRPSLPHLP